MTLRLVLPVYIRDRIAEVKAMITISKQERNERITKILKEYDEQVDRLGRAGVPVYPFDGVSR